MNYLNFYYLLPPSLKNFIATIYGLRQRINKFGLIIDKNDQLFQLRKNQWINYERIIENQKIALKNIILHAKHTVPYYKDILNSVSVTDIRNDPNSVLSSMPLLDKNTVLNHPKGFLSEKFDVKNLYSLETSGSTGTPLKIFCDKKAYSFNHALHLTRWVEWSGVNVKHRKIMFGGKPVISINQKNPPFWIKNYAENQMYCSIYHLSEENLRFYDYEIRKFNPKYIMEYPSAIYLYANYLYKRKMKLGGLKAILTGSENLDSEKRKIIENVFECKVYDGYSLSEYVNFISQCEFGSYHISPEAGIVELLDGNNNNIVDESLGKIISTTLFNFAMPLIRYDTGDLGSIPIHNKSNCQCGRELPILNSLDGRMISFLILPNGSRVGSAGLSTAFHLENLIESQIIQTSKDTILLKLVVSKKFSNKDLQNLLKELNKRVKPLQIKYEFVNSIQLGPNGKKHWIINEHKKYL